MRREWEKRNFQDNKNEIQRKKNKNMFINKKISFFSGRVLLY
jgi:hypothetical protein